MFPVFKCMHSNRVTDGHDVVQEGSLLTHWHLGDADVILNQCPYSKVHGANMGPTWVLSTPDGPHVGPFSLALGVISKLISRRYISRNFLWKDPQLNATRPHWWLVNIGWGIDFVPSRNSPLFINRLSPCQEVTRQELHHLQQAVSIPRKTSYRKDRAMEKESEKYSCQLKHYLRGKNKKLKCLGGNMYL